MYDRWRNQWHSCLLRLGRVEVTVTWRPMRWRSRWGIKTRQSADDN